MPVPTASARWLCAVAIIWYTLCGGLPVRADGPPKLDEKELASIRGNLSSREWEPNFELALQRRGEKMLPYFAHILTDEKSTNRQIERALSLAQKYLTKHDCKELVEPTVAHLLHHHPTIKAYALCLLKSIGKREDAVAAAVLLHDEDWGVRACAAWCLDNVGGKREMFPLDIWLADKSREKDKAFAEVKKSRDKLRERLEKAGMDKQVEPTCADKAVAEFADNDAKVRAAAVETLKRAGSRADSSAVVALLHDPDVAVRTAAAEWLGVMGGKRELLALGIRLREPKATDDPTFDAVAKARKAVAERVETEEKKLKAKTSENSGNTNTEPTERK